MNTKKLLNSKKRQRRKKWKNRIKSSNGWFTINIDLSDSIKIDWDMEKPRRVINSGKK